jgi:hypothetical protein
LKAVHHILVSSAETWRAFNSGFDTVNLHRPAAAAAAAAARCCRSISRDVVAHFEIGSND